MLTSCPLTSRADIIGGKSPSNCTSTTAPITCVTLPSIPAEALAAAKPLERSKSGGNCTAARPDIPPTEGRNLSTQRNDVAFLARSCLDNRPAIREKRHIVGMQSYCMCRVGEMSVFTRGTNFYDRSRQSFFETPINYYERMKVP